MESPIDSVLAVLEKGRQDVLSSAHDLSDQHAASKPAPDRWSVLECLEHIIVVEDRFLGWITTGELLEAPSADPAKESKLMEMLADRTEKRQAPEAVIPTGRYSTVAEALSDFEAARTRSAQIAQSRGQQLYSIKVKHPRFGEMNGSELLHLLTGHASRHAAQIRETRAALGT